jgi:ATP-binding cassette subfamily C protein
MSPPTDLDLTALLAGAAGGEEIEAGANQPLRLGAGASAWLVRSGRVELFAVAPPRGGSGGGAGAGVRSHLATLDAGELVASLDLGRQLRPFQAAERRDGEGEGETREPRSALLAVPHPGTRLIRLPAATLRELARRPVLAPALTRLVERWVRRLTGEVVRGRPPKHYQELRPGIEVRLPEAGTAARTARGVVWVRHLAGSCRFLGRDDLPITPEDFLLPVTDETWLDSAGEVHLSCVDGESLLRSGALWAGLDRFHHLLLAYADRLREEDADDERVRLARKTDLDRRTLETAHSRLAAVLGPRTAAGAPLEAGSDSLLEACRLVAEAQGIELRKPPDATAELPPRQRLARIAAASRIRHRRVLLRDDWWRRDNGPLLAFRPPEETGGPSRPVALLPRSPTRCELVEPGTGAITEVDEAVAEGLEGEAAMLYRPLPERALRFSDLLDLVFRRRRHDLATLLLMGLGVGLLAVLVPILTGYLFGTVIPAADRARLAQATIALVLAAVAGAAFQVTRSIAVLRLSGKVDGLLQGAVWDRLISLPVPFFRRYTVGDLADRAMGIDTIRQLLTGHVISSVLAAIFSVFSFGLLFYYSWPLALAASGLVALLAAVTTGLAYLQLRHQRLFLEHRGKVASLVFDLIHGIGKIRVGGAEHRAYGRWADGFSRQRREAVAARRIANLQGAFNAVYGLATAMTLFAMVTLSQQIDLAASDFLAFSAAFGQFQMAALSIIAIFPSLLAAIPVYERLQPILVSAPEVDPTKVEAGELAGEVEFGQVSFRYQADGPLILDRVSFHARPGEFIALVGPSGAGKSTCLRLLVGFERPTAGSIYYDGQDLGSLDLLSVRRQTGVVLQHSRPMAGDLHTNIVGSRNLTLDDAWEAARMAGLADDIRAMPMGMHTVISEGGGTFSGGQLQRLLIARAIVHRPRVLLFDEATSALDNRTQEHVTDSLERLKATRIVIAHRLSTIQNADRIYVLQRGKVVEAGSYDELAATGIFGQMVERQRL